ERERRGDNAAAAREMQAALLGDEEAAVQRQERVESVLDRLRASTADIQRLQDEVGVEPGSLWGTVIQELMVFHGLTAEGARRILETLKAEQPTTKDDPPLRF